MPLCCDSLQDGQDDTTHYWSFFFGFFTIADTILLAQKYCRNVSTNEATMNSPNKTFVENTSPEYQSKQA